MNKYEIAQLIDHTVLKPDATSADIVRLCEEANTHGFMAVCVNACHVALARNTASKEVLVACVVGFPLGATDTGTKAAEAAHAVTVGAGEIDMVINVGWLKEGLDEFVLGDILAVVQAVPGIPVKVIIETALLTDQEKIRACELAKTAGAAFVKTSTGFGPGGATVDDVRLMRSVVGADLGVKASGGVRTLAQVLDMANAGANRIGSSSGVAIIREMTK
ncbi:MAG TPA: deoxyribose-phosphate aldolase [Bacillota bacterium]|nr:deoxyribose-phosphate aldolase [Bacillota bacterium]